MQAYNFKSIFCKKLARMFRIVREPAFWKTSVFKAARFILLAGLAFVILFPLLVRFSSAFMSVDDLLDKTVLNIPRNPTLDNFRTVIRQTGYYRALVNTTLISLMCAVFQTVVAVVVGYGLAKFKFKGRSLLSAIVILLMIVPPQVLLLPMYMQFRFFDIYGVLQLLTGKPINMIDNMWAPVILSMTGLGLKNGLYIFVMRQFFIGTPDELIEAATIDGASPYRTFFTVMAPLGSATITTIILLSFSWQWTDTFYSGMFFSNVRVLPNILGSIVGVMHMIGAEAYLSALLNTGALLILLPLLVLYVFMQRRFIEGFERSGITG